MRFCLQCCSQLTWSVASVPQRFQARSRLMLLVASAIHSFCALR
jgi:hypothetical protein